MNTHLWIGQQERTDELNERIRDRQFIERPLPPNSFRPCQTKYTLFTALDNRIPPSTLHHSVLLNVDSESMLKNQTSPLQRGSQNVYVPSSSSDLYKVHVSSVNNEPQPFPHLFERPTLQTSREQRVMPEKNRFSNSTRIQLKEIK